MSKYTTVNVTRMNTVLDLYAGELAVRASQDVRVVTTTSRAAHVWEVVNPETGTHHVHVLSHGTGLVHHVSTDTDMGTAYRSWTVDDWLARHWELVNSLAALRRAEA